MADAFKFVHASDFHLDKPISGLTEIPNHLKSQLANAPYAAAERVFDIAINEKVDFVLLAGDICDLENGGPRAAAFLMGQLERLADKDINVYWCGSQTDHPDRWPNAVELPENVVVFPTSAIERVVHRRNGRAIAQIAGCGYGSKKRLPSDFYCEPEGPFAIALSHSDFDPTTLSAQNVQYWALGGRHQRKVLDKTGSVAIFPGTPQARSPRETGSHSCTVARVDANGKCRTQEVDVDIVRWCVQKIKIAETINLEALKTLLSDRCQQIRSESPDQTCLVKWEISTAGDFNPELRRDAWHDDVVGFLRNEFGQEGGVWTDQLTIDPPNTLPAGWYEEDTILGDYLRAVGRFQSDESIKLGFHEHIPSDIQDENLIGMTQIDSAERKRILRRAALIGVEYLGAGEGFDEVE